MNEYKSVRKYLNENKSSFSLGKVFRKIFNQILFCILILLIGLIILKYDNNNSKIIYKAIYEDNLSFAKVNSWFKEKFGSILPFQEEKDNKVAAVFNETLIYDNLSIYEDGVSLDVSTNYLVPVLEEGIVIFIGEKTSYGNTIIIQQKDGVNVWYGNVSNANVSLYDYVSKGEFLATAIDNKLYLVFQKEDQFVSYKEYFK